mgnify:CR=1 FL=1
MKENRFHLTYKKKILNKYINFTFLKRSVNNKMRNFFVILYLFLTIFSVGCSRSSLEKIDLDKIKKEALEKKDDIEKIQEKIKKLKK